MSMFRQAFVLCVATLVPAQAERFVASDSSRATQLTDRTGGGTTHKSLEDSLWLKSSRTCEDFESVDLADDDERRTASGYYENGFPKKKTCECVAPYELWCDMPGKFNWKTSRGHGKRAFDKDFVDPSTCQCKKPDIRCGSMPTGAAPEDFEDCLLDWGDIKRSWYLMSKNLSYHYIRVNNATCQDKSFCKYPSYPEDDPDRSAEEGHRGTGVISDQISTDDCFHWAKDYCILPGHHFGSAPTSIRQKWQSNNCRAWPKSHMFKPCGCSWGCDCDRINWGSANTRERAWFKNVGCK